MAGDRIDFEAEGFYAGLDGAARDERRELLGWLLEQGFSADELRRAHRRGLLVFLGAEREVGGDPRHTLREVAADAGVDLQLLERLRRAQGLPVPDPDAREQTDVDLEAARTTRRFVELGLSEEQMLATTRVMGRGLARAAEAMRGVMLEQVLEPGTTERELAERYGAAVHATMPLVGPLVLQALSQHLRNMLQTEAVGAAERAAGTVPGSRPMTVAFADLVGFTRLGEEIPPEDLGRVAERLFALSADLVAPPVRIVKTIGDAVMVTATEPEPLVDFALRLVAATEGGAAGEAFPQIRVGVAHGLAVARAGDVFGRAVNLASRVTAVARASSVLATRDVRDGARDRFRWSSAGARRLKGVPDPVPLYRARPLAAAS
ncbi:MAG TPA: adenylate cyclase regulatory domain-containing protein [Baekduia sp.]|nr:adenylate cyclase regulatory domain-containing protein [Baekduia sp.]